MVTAASASRRAMPQDPLVRQIAHLDRLVSAPGVDLPHDLAEVQGSARGVEDAEGLVNATGQVLKPPLPAAVVEDLDDG
jgi:hypothetical protein